MSAVGRESARAAAGGFLAACLPGADPPGALVTETFRCWTPLGDWQHGTAALAALRQVMAAFCSRLPGTAAFRPDTVVAGESAVVVEAKAPGIRQEIATMTVVLTLRSGLVEEARCYVDPRALGIPSGGKN